MVGSKREEIKRMIASMKEYNPHVDTNIFNSVHNINLANIVGYHKGDMAYNFLDDYQERGKVKAETAGGAAGASRSGCDGAAGSKDHAAYEDPADYQFQHISVY